MFTILMIYNLLCFWGRMSSCWVLYTIFTCEMTFWIFFEQRILRFNCVLALSFKKLEDLGLNLFFPLVPNFSCMKAYELRSMSKISYSLTFTFWPSRKGRQDPVELLLNSRNVLHSRSFWTGENNYCWIAAMSYIHLISWFWESHSRSWMFIPVTVPTDSLT